MARPKEFEHTATLDKAVNLFWEKGYEATSIQDLVEKMEINRGSLYDTFGSKEELFLTVIDRYGDIVVDKLLNILKLSGESKPKASIQQFFNTIVDHITSRGPLRGCLVTNSAVETALSNPIIAKKVEIILNRIEDCFYRNLLQAQKAGDIQERKDVRALARYLTSGLQGLLVIGKIRPEREFLQDIVNVQLHILD